MTTENMLQEIQDKIGNYMQHGGAIEGGGWKVYDPISLTRVLSELGEPRSYLDGRIGELWRDGYYATDIKRKLLNQDKSDCMLSDQSPETIKAIWEIVCK